MLRGRGRGGAGRAKDLSAKRSALDFSRGLHAVGTQSGVVRSWKRFQHEYSDRGVTGSIH